MVVNVMVSQFENPLASEKELKLSGADFTVDLEIASESPGQLLCLVWSVSVGIG